MTYEEYKSTKNNSTKKRKSSSFLKNILGKFFTIVIFVMLVVIVSNYSESFRNFIINDVLNNTMDFSKINNLVDSMTSIFKTNVEDSTLNVASIKDSKPEKYKDGVKYRVKENENVIVKDSGIVTFIGKKDGYNNTIIVQQSNGYYAWYGNVKESVKLYDYVESGSILGTASLEYYYVLLKDDKPVDILNEN